MATIARAESISVADPAYQAYQILHIGFTVAPILFGLDKFFNFMVDWEKYVAPWLVRIIGNAHTFMLGVGIVEIVAGLLVAFKPRWGAYIVALAIPAYCLLRWRLLVCRCATPRCRAAFVFQSVCRVLRNL